MMQLHNAYPAPVRPVVAAMLTAGAESLGGARFWTDLAHDVGAVERRPGAPFALYIGRDATYFEWLPPAGPRVRVPASTSSVREACGPGAWYHFDGKRFTRSRGRPTA